MPREQFASIGTPRGDLFAVTHHPDGPPRAGVLIIHPFAEEKKFAHRALVRLSRELASRGHAVLRFDLWGCGDSPGDSAEATWAGWIEDVAAASEVLSKPLDDDIPIVFLGLRLGATLALAAQADNAWASRVVLWEPILSGKKYIDEVLRRRMIKEMMTTGKKATGREQVLEQLRADGFLDLDGYAVGRQLIERISALDAQQLARGAAKRRNESHDPADILLVQIAFNAKVSTPLEELANVLRQSGSEVQAIGIREQTLWDRVELVEGKELIDATAGWVCR